MPNLRSASLFLALVAVVAISFATRPAVQADDHEGSRLAWRKNYKQACEEARRRKRPILVRITASWCGPCRQMQQLTFTDDHLKRKLRKDFVLLEVDADEQPDLVTAFHVEAFPTTLVVSPELKVVSRMTGFKSAPDLITSLNLVKQSPLDDEELLADGELPGLDDREAVSALAAANTIKLGFDGFCLVSLLDENRLRKGEATYLAEHRGQTVCFFSDEHRQRFLANPDRFWPAANGKCLVTAQEGNGVGPGDPRAGVIWRGKLWFFSDRDTQQRFLAMPYQYSSGL